jgi:SPP1 gp7 family putative phage head morphogenesis protein
MKDVFTDEEMNAYLLAVYTGLISVDTLSDDYHTKVAGTLYNGVNEGFGAVRNNKVEADILNGLQNSVYRFSAAKQYQQVREMESILATMSKAAGDLVPYNEFKKSVTGVFENYNKNWLATEYNTAVDQSQNARKWAKVQAEKETFPLLRYKTQNDGNVRDAHAQLDGIIKPVNDAFWDNNLPANGWNCRCFVQQLDEGTITEGTPELSEVDQPLLFRMNSGKDKYIFKNTHPYYDISKGDGALKKNNFNLPDKP